MTSSECSHSAKHSTGLLLVARIRLECRDGAWRKNLANGRMIDLTHSFNSETIYWPTEDGFKLIPENGRRHRARATTTPPIDSVCPSMAARISTRRGIFSKPGQTVDQVPLKRLIGPAACVDITQQCVADPDYQATVDDFEGWELVQGSSLDDRIVLIRTGFCRFWPDRETYLGTTEQGKAASPSSISPASIRRPPTG